MSRKGNNRRRELRRKPKAAKSKQKDKQTEVVVTSRNERENEINKRYLILCEGETEEAYFSGLRSNVLLKEKFKAVKIEIIAPHHKKGTPNKLKDNSLMGLVWEAMKRKKAAQKERNPYDEIWIVTDNDERNSYIISKNTLKKTKDILTPTQYKKLSGYLDAFFLSDRDYKDFLQNTIGLTNPKMQEVIEKTDKNTLFDDYENPDPKTMFYSGSQFVYGQNRDLPPDEKDFDPTWKSWLKKAYSCRTFESWLILHFEACKIPFTVCKEISDSFNPANIIHHLWKFAPYYVKGFDAYKTGKPDAYNILKPFPFNPKYETEIEAQAVIDKVHVAMLRAYWLREQMQIQLKLQSGRYYEVNPYTDVDHLLSNLLEREVTYAHFNQLINFDEMQIKCVFDSKNNELKIIYLANLSSDNSILINANNVENFFKILTVNNKYEHEYIFPVSINKTIHVNPEGAAQLFTVQFQNIPQSIETYMVIQNKNQNRFLYLPIQNVSV